MRRALLFISFAILLLEVKAQELNQWIHQTDSIISSCNIKLNSIDFERVKLLPIYDFTIDEVEESIAFIEHQNKKLNFNNNSKHFDEFHKKFTILKINTGKKRIVLNQKLAFLDYEFYKKGKEHLNMGERKKAEELFEKSVETNYFYSLSHSMLANIYYLQEDFNKAAEKVYEAYTQTYPDDASRKELFKIAVKIKDGYFRFVDSYLEKEQFNQVLKKLEPAHEICNNLQIDCIEEINKRLSAATFGIYKAYLSVAKRAISSNQPTFAEQYIAKAKNYQIEHKEIVIGTTEADELLLSISDVYEEKGVMLMQGGDFEEAIEHFNKALYFCKQNKEDDCNEKLSGLISESKKALYDQLIVKADRYLEEENFENAEFYVNKAIEFQNIHSKDIPSTQAIDEILSRLNFVQYKYLITEGTYFIKKDEYEIALENLEAALNLENQYAFEKDTNLLNLRQKAAKPLIMDLLSTSSLKAWAKEFDLSRSYLKKGISLQEKYLLTTDEEINKKIDKINKKLN